MEGGLTRAFGRRVREPRAADVQGVPKDCAARGIQELGDPIVPALSRKFAKLSAPNDQASDTQASAFLVTAHRLWHTGEHETVPLDP